MSKLLKGLMLGAAVLSAGSARAALVQFDVYLTGQASIINYDWDTGIFTESGGAAWGRYSFSVEESDLATGSYYNPSNGATIALSPTTFSSQFGRPVARMEFGSISATFAPDTFDLGNLAINAEYYPLSGTGRWNDGGHYSGASFQGIVTKITTTARPSTGQPGGGSFSFAVVPEPTTWAMMLIGFGAIGAALRRSRQASSSALSSVSAL